MTRPQAVGIDLGTTYSAVATIDPAGHTAMLRNSEGELLTPSVVLFDEREIVVGRAAKKMAGLDPDRVAECAKRDMGRPSYAHPIRGALLPPEVIQACILRKLHHDVVTALGSNVCVVITVPAYFDEARRKATADAAQMAGFEILDIVNEPTAAALAFGEAAGYLDKQGAPQKTEKVLVYDLGGGTFDVTLLELRPGHVHTIATDGDAKLGGYDWDVRLADHLAEQFVKQHRDDPRSARAAHVRLIRAAEEAKHTLSAREQASVHVEHAGHSCDVAVTRAQFEELTADLVERTSHTTRELLTTANVLWRDVTKLLLVGGSTRMPMIGRALRQFSGLAPDQSVHPDEAVARGAAIYARYLLSQPQHGGAGASFQVVNVNAHSLGIAGVDQRTLRRENVILIPRNTPLPSRATEKFVTRNEDQKTIVVQVLEGESSDPAQCSPVARAVLRKLPAGLPKGWPIDVTYEYATNGRLSVQAVVPGTGSEVTMELERDRGLSDERIAKWKRVVSAPPGTDSFDALIDEVLEETDAPRPAPVSTHPAASAPSFPATAPQPAAQPSARADDDALPVIPQSRAAPARKTNPLVRFAFVVIGYALSAGIVLSAGYYLLCWIKPDANFLNLTLPGLRPPKDHP